MGRTSLGYELTTRALSGGGAHSHKSALSDETIKSYKRSCKDFAEFCKAEKGIKSFADVSAKTVQDYADFLVDRGATAGTVHTKLAPVCKALDIGMAEIDKPKRIAAQNVRGRFEVPRSVREMELERYKPSVELQKALGIRRNELKNLCGKDIMESEKGLYVVVQSGKGGKKQVQRVLPEYEGIVRAAFERIADDERVLKPENISKNINYHGLRAQTAQQAYAYYANRLEKEPEYRQELVSYLTRKFTLANKKASPKAFERFKYDLRDKPYFLRSDNKKLALERGLLVKYDRLALMAVSVEHLSHWRLDVTVCNYILA